MANPVGWFEIMGKDGNALRTFYERVFNWQMQVDEASGYAMTGPDGGAGVGIGATPDGAKRVTFYVAVPDLNATLATVTSKGGSVLMPPMDVPNGPTIAMFADPEGNVIGLMKQ